MAYYLVRARPREGALHRVRQLLDGGTIASMRPFGPALDLSLRGARYDLKGTLLWEEEDYRSQLAGREIHGVGWSG